MHVCVFCGSASGNSTVFSHAAHELGNLLGNAGHTLIYGGGNIGLMGILADAVLAAGGQVVGVIPEFLVHREVAHKGLTDLIVVPGMHERKKKMADLSRAFIAMPGGWGTLDELAEILTWRQLDLINQPIGILNVAGFFTPLIKSMETMRDSGFLKPENFNSLLVKQTPQELLTALGVNVQES